jgi:ABC-type protease/lipase transport system fused ATPase/permease subunit
MRAARAKVVKGKIVTRAKFPEGTKLYLVVDEPVAPLELDAKEEAAIGRALSSVRAGKSISLAQLGTTVERL